MKKSIFRKVFLYSTPISLSTADNAVSGRFFFSFPNPYWSENTEGIYDTAMGEIAEASASLQSNVGTPSASDSILSQLQAASFSLTVESDGDETGLVLKLLNNGSEKAYLTQIVCKNSTKAGKEKMDYLSYVGFIVSGVVETKGRSIAKM